MPKHIPPKIEDKGLEHHLNATRSLHNDYGYEDFVKMRKPTPAVNPVNMARIFGVTRATMNKWISIYNKENDQQ